MPTRIRFCIVLFGAFLPTAATAGPWKTFRGDLQRRGVSKEHIDVRQLGLAWSFRSAHPPRTAWGGPAKWDAYAGIRGLRDMRDYDRCFPVAVAGASVYFGSSTDDALRCLDARTGRQQWIFFADGPIRVAPSVANGRIYFGSDDGCAYCLEAATGRLAWKYRPPVNEPLILNNGRFISKWPCRSGVAVVDGTAFAAFSLLPWQPSWLCALNAKTGQVSGEGRYARKLTGLTLEGGVLVQKARVVLSQGRVEPMMFDRKTGAPIGPLKNGGGSFLSADDAGSIFHGPGNKTGWVVESDAATRRVRRVWQGSVGVVSTKLLRVWRSDRNVVAMKRRGGTVQWKTPFRITFDHIVAGETVFVGADNEVRALSLRTGRTVWRGRVTGNALSLAVADGRLYVSTNRGHVYCFHRTASRFIPPPVIARKPARRQTARTAGIEPVDHPALIHRWVFRSGMNERDRRRGVKNAAIRVPDLAGNLHGRVLGDMRLQGVGGIEALVFDGRTTSVQLHDDYRKVGLPARAMTAEAWVRVDKPLRWGGLIGAFQDNGRHERGWLLGYVDDRFSFAVAAKSGAKQMTYLTAKTPFVPGEWYHVVGTYNGRVQRLFVNGRLANESRRQSGDIHEPARAFVEMGAYHDRDEYFRLTGMIHDVRLYKSALTPGELRRSYLSGRSRIPRRIELAAGPSVRFESPTTAEIRWKTGSPSPTRLQWMSSAGPRLFGDASPKTSHTVRIDGLQRERVYRYSIGTTANGRSASTPLFELETHFNYTLPPLRDLKNVGNVARRGVDRLLRAVPSRRGICLVWGSGDGQFLYELARRTRLRVVAVETNAARLASARRFLVAHGSYGVRVGLLPVETYKRLPLHGSVANLVVADPQFNQRTLKTLKRESLRLLRPGGHAVLRNGSDRDKAALIVVKKKAGNGAGEWSHLYGRADNAAFGGESLRGIRSANDLRVQWIGLPGPRAQADRNGRKPSPLARNGRLFVQGLNRIAALDAHNGSILWSLEIPGFERFNMPRDCGNWCADDKFLFAAHRDRCWQIDAQTGRVVRMHSTDQDHGKARRTNWGYVARVGDALLGSSVRRGASYTNFWGKGDAGWYDNIKGAVTYKVCSDRLFALEAKSGKRRWQYADGAIMNSTITATRNRVYFLECRHSKIRTSEHRRIGSADLWSELFFVALDLKTGKTAWERKLNGVRGDVAVFLAASNGKLVLSTSGAGEYRVRVFTARDGTPLWQQRFGWPGGKHDHGKALSRPAVAGGFVFLRPKAMDLHTGKFLERDIPHGGCGTYACTTQALLYRNGSGGKMTVWDPRAGATSTWGRLRPGCWLSTIPACGMLLSPEAGGGCSCGKWMEASFGFVPKDPD